MKTITKIIFALSIATTIIFGADAQMKIPSSVPINVFEMQKDQIGIGYIQFGTTLKLVDDYYQDKIGDVDYKTKGLLVTLPKSSDTILGKMFELSYTAGAISSQIKDGVFIDNGKLYNNTYNKSGLYVGVRPAFSLNIYESDIFKIQNSTSLHMFLYTLSGDFSVRNDAGANYSYNETNIGLGIKPTTIINATYFPMHNLGLTLFGGLSTFLALDYNSYENKYLSFDYDDELSFMTATIDPIYGFDIVLRNIFNQYDSFNVSSLLTKKDSGTSTELIVRYIFNF